MSQVIRSLDVYFTMHALHANWTAFCKRIGAFELPHPLTRQSEPPESLANVANLDELSEAHEAYVDEVIQW